MNSIKSNIEKVILKIEKAAYISGRNPSEVKLIAVSKQFDVENIINAVESGLCRFGENYAQEFRDKYKNLEQYNEQIEWHFIGHLQKNKIKYVVGKTELIHSLDNIELANELNKKAESLDKSVNVLIEINSGNEKSKSGVNFNQAEELILNLQSLEYINLNGFMTMPPYFENSNEARPYFKEMREFRDRIIKNYPNAIELSMGMSNDFEVAIEEGATYVRVGSAIFGQRNY